MPSDEVTQAELKRKFYYNPLTGLFTSKFNHGRIKKGDVIGTMMPNGYLRTVIRGKSYWLHRLVFLYVDGQFPAEVDHRNRETTDNRYSNLRKCNRRQNSGNVGLRKHNTSGFKGVFKCRSKWVVKCCGKHIGVYSNPIDAAKRYDLAAKEYFGDFAKTNESLGLL